MQTEPYKLEIYWRDGSFAACQYETKTVSRDEAGAVIREFPNPPEDLDLAAISAILPDLNADAFAQVEALTTTNEDLTSRVETLTSERGELTSQVETLTSERGELTSQVETLTSERGELTSQVESLTSDRGELTSQVETLTSQLETANARIAELEAVPEEPVIVGISKLTIMRRLGDKWPTLKASLLTLPEIVQDAWLLAQEIRADDELFVAYKDTLQTLLDLTDEEFTALLTP
jgi:SMC interacting uncharacterized protein involved in chromosome segregation